MINDAIILAGGLGTRLRTAVPDLPKCMAPVNGKPFLSYLIDYYSAQGIGNFIFSLGYMHEHIEAFLKEKFGSRNNYQVSLENEPLGTGGGIRKACEYSTADNLLILNGDTFFAVDLKKLAAFHDGKNADCTLSLKEMHNSDRYGVVEIDREDKINSFKEKKFYPKSLINGGVYALNRTDFIKDVFPEKFSFEKEYLESFYTKRNFAGMVQDGYFIDIGVPEDYNRAQTELLLNI